MIYGERTAAERRPATRPGRPLCARSRLPRGPLGEAGIPARLAPGRASGASRAGRRRHGPAAGTRFRPARGAGLDRQEHDAHRPQDRQLHRARLAPGRPRTRIRRAASRPTTAGPARAASTPARPGPSTGRTGSTPANASATGRSSIAARSPKKSAEGLDGWAFGCDVCQDVCPWNRKAPPGREPALAGRTEWTDPDLIAWLGAGRRRIRAAGSRGRPSPERRGRGSSATRR